jgi:hypothetical protein
MESCGLDSYGTEQGPVAGSCEHDNEPSGSIKGGEFHYWLTTSFSKGTLLHVVSQRSQYNSKLILCIVSHVTGMMRQPVK